MEDKTLELDKKSEIRNKYHNFNKYPEKRISGFTAYEGWDAFRQVIKEQTKKKVIAAEFYPGVNRKEIVEELGQMGYKLVSAEDCCLSDKDYQKVIKKFLTEDRVFGIMNTLRLEDVYIEEKVAYMRSSIEKMVQAGEKVIVYGTGATIVAGEDCEICYFDMPRWEIQCRFRKGLCNWKTDNAEEDKLKKFKQGFFVEWRMADRHKKTLLDKMDWVVDTVIKGLPKVVSGEGFRKGMETFAKEPFRLVPYYAPEVWGGQWMKEICGLDADAENYAWAFDGVPEENSIFLRFGEVRMEFPSVNAVFYRPAKLLGSRVHARFGDEFPIRFDFLDTMGGQNLSLQVHPLTEYIQNTFGMHYTQDESYYVLDCREEAVVYLGLKEGICKEEMLGQLEEAQENGSIFEAEKYVNVWQAKKHDHFLIPAGTVHCSGKDTMVLEISATPYIFTFKLWDWGRLGLDGRPRPVHLQHGSKVIQWDRTTGWVKENLINHFETICEEPGFQEIKTGLHEREFIETRRYKLSVQHTFFCDDSVSMCNVVDGEGVVVSSPEGKFTPFEVHYAETFIIPAAVGCFTMEPLREECMVLRANIR